MATKRLSKEDKSNLSSDVSAICERLNYLTEDPINSIGMTRINFLKTLVPNELCKALGTVEKFTSTDAMYYSHRFKFHLIRSCGTRLEFSCYLDDAWVSLPDRLMRVSTKHPLFNSLETFGAAHVNMAARVTRAQVTLKHVIFSCSSVGQIQRVIPNIMEFVPSCLSNSLSDAERKSRAPVLDRDNKATPVRIEEAVSTLAFGTLKGELSREEKIRCIAVGATYVR